MPTRLRTFLCLLTVVVAASTASALQINPILRSSSNSLTANVTEQATSCSYDKNNLTPSMTSPPRCGPLNKSDWPQWLHDAGHSGYNPDERVVSPSNVGQLQALWMMYTPNYMPYTFAVANGILYGFGIDYYTGQQGLYAVKGTTGSAFLPKWMIPSDRFDGSCFSYYQDFARLTVDGGIVYLGCPYQTYLIDAASGAILQQGYDLYPFTVYKGGLYGNGWQFVTGPGWQYELRGVSISLRYPQWVVVSGPVCRCGPDDRLVSCWLHGDSLLDKTVEQLSPAVRLAPVEPEGKLVQIAIQMLDAHRSLMCAQ